MREQTFTASEAAEITGVSVEKQRDWRRRRLITKLEDDWSRLTVEQLCGLMMMDDLSNQGVPLRDARSFVNMYAEIVATDAVRAWRDKKKKPTSEIFVAARDKHGNPMSLWARDEASLATLMSGTAPGLQYEKLSCSSEWRAVRLGRIEKAIWPVLRKEWRRPYIIEVISGGAA